MNEEAYSLALKRLNARDYSSAELAAYLERKGVSQEDAAEVVAALSEKHFLDDERYAGAVARSQARRGKSTAYIHRKLKQKGLRLPSTEIKRFSLEATGKDEQTRALEILERRYPDYRTDRAVASKALQALLRRGFDYEVAMDVIRGTLTRR
jgi:SOS response regulatory protein OraA/RecX